MMVPDAPAPPTTPGPRTPIAVAAVEREVFDRLALDYLADRRVGLDQRAAPVTCTVSSLPDFREVDASHLIHLTRTSRDTWRNPSFWTRTRYSPGGRKGACSHQLAGCRLAFEPVPIPVAVTSAPGTAAWDASETEPSVARWLAND
jgi:hypothetical protein